MKEFSKLFLATNSSTYEGMGKIFGIQVLISIENQRGFFV